MSDFVGNGLRQVVVKMPGKYPGVIANLLPTRLHTEHACGPTPEIEANWDSLQINCEQLRRMIN
jgi:hypothetical protein